MDRTSLPFSNKPSFVQVGRKLFILSKVTTDCSPFPYRIKSYQINCNKSFMVHETEIMSLFNGHKTLKKFHGVVFILTNLIK